MSPIDHLDLVVCKLGRRLDSYDRYAVGLHHVAFAASSRGTVDERAGWLRAQGAQIESDHGSTAARSATTPSSSMTDAIKLELVHRPGERDLAAQIRRLEARLARVEQERG